MLRQKTGLPEEGELVLCTVLKVQHNSVFVKLNEYGDTGLIHISEVSPGRIRNIRDFVKEDKVVVCKVLRINRERGYIDLSLRRVTEIQRRNKINELKQEQIAEKILEMVCKKHNLDVKQVFTQIERDVFVKYEMLYSAFAEANEKLLLQLKFPKEIIGDLLETIAQRIKPESVTISGRFAVSSYAPNGVAICKEAILAGQNAVPEFSIRYAGGGKYMVTLTQPNYKLAEKKIETLTETIDKKMRDAGGEFTFTRDEKK
ncbi:MAG: S1 RNA-binding domain-containing protein [Nanoarchaeota archaeon]